MVWPFCFMNKNLFVSWTKWILHIANMFWWFDVETTHACLDDRFQNQLRKTGYDWQDANARPRDTRMCDGISSRAALLERIWAMNDSLWRDLVVKPNPVSRTWLSTAIGSKWISLYQFRNETSSGYCYAIIMYMYIMWLARTREVRIIMGSNTTNSIWKSGRGANTLNTELIMPRP